jgi:hypothetical protein
MDKQSLILIALEMDLPDILNFCKTSKRVNDAVCKNPFFWINKMKKDYNFNFIGKATENRDPREYYSLLSKNEKFWSKNMNKDKIIAQLIKQGNREMVIYFLNKYKTLDKNISMFQRSPMTKSQKQAAVKDDWELINLINKDSIRNNTSLAKGFAKAGNFDEVRKILESNTRLLNITEILIESIKSGNLELVKYLENKITGDVNYNRYLEVAAKYGKRYILEYLLQKNRNFFAVLIGAVQNKNHEALEYVKYALDEFRKKKDFKPILLDIILERAIQAARKSKQKMMYRIIRYLISEGATFENCYLNKGENIDDFI